MTERAETLEGLSIQIAGIAGHDGWDGALLDEKNERLVWTCGHAHADRLTGRLDALLCVATEVHRRGLAEHNRELSRRNQLSEEGAPKK